MSRTSGQNRVTCIALDRDGDYFVIVRVEVGSVLIRDPDVDVPEVLTPEALRVRWSSRLILIASRLGLPGVMQRFDFPLVHPGDRQIPTALIGSAGVSFAIQGVAQDCGFCRYARIVGAPPTWDSVF